MEALLAVAVGVTVVAGALAALAHWIVKPVWRTWRRASAFFEDFYGERGRPGVPARPGVMEQLAEIHAELRPNGGGSLRDAVNRIETNLNQHVTDESAHRPRSE